MPVVNNNLVFYRGVKMDRYRRQANIRAKNIIAAYISMWQGTNRHSWPRKQVAAKAYVFRHLAEQDKWLAQ